MFIENHRQSAVQVSKKFNIPRTSLRQRIYQEFKVPNLVTTSTPCNERRRPRSSNTVLSSIQWYTSALCPSNCMEWWSQLFSFKWHCQQTQLCLLLFSKVTCCFWKTCKFAKVLLYGLVSVHLLSLDLIFDGPVNGTNYLDMITTFVFPAIREIVGANGDGADYWWQQDGAPPHYFTPVRDTIDNEFPERWIGRRGFVEWPARSPDITPMDYAVWGIMKVNVFKVHSQSLAELRGRFIDASNDFNENLCQSICRSLPSCMVKCILSDGHHFE